MFDFIKDSINKKALKRALFEVDIEEEKKKQVLVDNKPLREHKTNEESVPFKKPRFNNSLSKPQTEAVDLKNFKNWRNVTKVEKPLETKSSAPRFNFLDTDDDEGEQPEIDNPVSTNKTSFKPKFSSDIEASESNVKTEEKDTSIDSFFKEKYNFLMNSNNELKQLKEETTANVDDQPEKPHVKVSLNDLLKRKNEELNATKESDKKSEDKTQENLLKVEVVDLTEKTKNETKPNVPKVKKTVNRKPRGKNKRRFDADVISSVDWK